MVGVVCQGLSQQSKFFVTQSGGINCCQVLSQLFFTPTYQVKEESEGAFTTREVGTPLIKVEDSLENVQEFLSQGQYNNKG